MDPTRQSQDSLGCFIKVLDLAQKFANHKMNSEQIKIGSIFGATVLAHTMFNGLGIINMIHDVCDHYDRLWKASSIVYGG